MLQRAVELVPLRGPQLVEVPVDPLARLSAALAVAAARYLTTSSRARTAWAMSSSMDGRDYSTRLAGHVESLRQSASACTPRRRTRRSTPCRRGRASGPRRPSSTRPSAAMMRSAAAPSSMCRSIRTADSSSAVGFAMFLPAMSGALPCTASNTPIVGAEVRGADDAEPADQPGAEIRHDVAVQVRHHQHVELPRVHHQVHARGVDDLLVVRDVGVLAGDACGRSRGTARRRAS